MRGAGLRPQCPIIVFAIHPPPTQAPFWHRRSPRCPAVAVPAWGSPPDLVFSGRCEFPDNFGNFPLRDAACVPKRNEVILTGAVDLDAGFSRWLIFET